MMQVDLTTSPPSPPSELQRQAVFNNQYANALASADPRYQMKDIDRPGVSRGRGTMRQAGVAASQALSDGIAAAYSNQLQNQAAAASMALQGQAAQQQYGQALSGLQQQNRYAAEMAALQRQNAFMGLLGSLLR